MQAKDLEDHRTWKSVGFRPFGRDIMVMDPATVHHDEAVDKLARKLGMPRDQAAAATAASARPRLA